MARRFRSILRRQHHAPNNPEHTRFPKLIQWKWIWLFLVAVLFSLSCRWLTAEATPALQPPLSTRGAQIIDATGRSVLLRGVNWFGMESNMHAPHGLWSRDYKEMLAQIKTLGYNVIRLPYSVQGLRASDISGVDFSIGSNRDLEGKTPLEVMDLIVQEADRQGLLVLLDSHRLNDQQIPELWYGDGFTEADWIDTWKMLALRYKNQPNVIGADLKNEPHGRASWGTNDHTTDWRLAAERAGNTILTVNPNWLIVVEGVEQNVPGQKLKRHWQGGNLEGVAKYPVRLNNPRKLVYSPHEYGPGVFNQTWFSEASFPRNLRSRWETGWHYIASRNIAPIFIGEFGGRQVDTSSKEGIWQRELVGFIQQKNLNFTYWSWNPNSTDTGGILLDDWKTVDQPKQQLLSQLLPVAGIPGTTLMPTQPQQAPLPRVQPSPTLRTQSHPQSSPKTSSRTSPMPLAATSPSVAIVPPSGAQAPTSGMGDLQANVNIQSDWQTGFCVDIRVMNPSNQPSRSWQLSFQMNQATINQSWNGNFNRLGSQYTVEPANWARKIQPQQTVNLGFCANKLGPDYQPKQVAVS